MNPNPQRSSALPANLGAVRELRIPRSALRAQRAFSLIEILVVVALLSVIVLGLLTMFSQTQKAFRTGMTQVDVLEAGRVATDMIARELEQLTPANRAAYNFYAQNSTYAPLTQPLPGNSPAVMRTNVIQDLFFMIRENQNWTGIGYFVRTNYAPTGSLGLSPFGLGTLYRFETNMPVAPFDQNPSAMFYDTRNPNGPCFINALRLEPPARKILDGVIHFRVRAFDTNGIPITRSNNKGILVLTSPFSPDPTPDSVQTYQFTSNAVPAFVEVEIGILEDRAWDRFKGIPVAAAGTALAATPQYRYLTNQAGRVHVFRQRIPVRSVVPTAYQ